MTFIGLKKKINLGNQNIYARRSDVNNFQQT